MAVPDSSADLRPTDGADLDGRGSIAVAYMPRTRAFRRYVTFYGLVVASSALLFVSLQSVLIPLQVQQIEFARIFTGANAGIDIQSLTKLAAAVADGTVVPTGAQQAQIRLLAEFNASRASSLSVVTSISIFVTMLIQPIVGVLSDRTRSRWGRRAPYIAAGGVAGAALVGFLAWAPSIAVVVVLYSLVQIAVNTAMSPLAATVADRVPESRIGTVSAVTGMMGYVAGVVGALVVGVLFAAIGLGAYVPIGVVLLIACGLFVLIARDKPSTDLAVERPTVRNVLGSYVFALRDRDFRWAWIAKVLLFIGYGISLVYAVYMLQSYIQPAVSAAQAAVLAPLISAAGVPSTVIGMAVTGRWSDRIGRRKPFVVGASLIMAASFIIPFVAPTLPALFAQAIVLGFGFGTFLVVDQALFIDVLPDRTFAARDLGLATLGANLGQAIGPAIAGLVVSAFGGSYGAVWPVASVLVVLAALAILPLRRVR